MSAFKPGQTVWCRYPRKRDDKEETSPPRRAKLRAIVTAESEHGTHVRYVVSGGCGGGRCGHRRVSRVFNTEAEAYGKGPSQ